MVYTASPPSALDVFIAKDTAIGNTAVNDISNHPGGSTVHHLHSLKISNSTGGAGNIYVKLYDNKAPVVGTSEPEVVLFVKAATNRELSCPDGLPFFNGISACAVTAGGTAGTTTPSAAVTAEFIIRTV